MDNIEEVKCNDSKCNDEKLSKNELDNLYFIYSKNFLTGCKEFEHIDNTLSEVFLALSKLCLNRISPENIANTNMSDQSKIDESHMKINSLPKKEKEKILNEIKGIEDEILC